MQENTLWKEMGQIFYEKLSGRHESIKAIAIIVPESRSYSPNPVLRFPGHPYSCVGVLDNVLVGGIYPVECFL